MKLIRLSSFEEREGVSKGELSFVIRGRSEIHV